jgi:DNA-binding beta-propeller fold protein YncE
MSWRKTWILSLTLIVLVAAGCGGGSSSSSNTTVGVTLSTGAATLAVNASLQLSAVVSNSTDSTVNWSVCQTTSTTTNGTTTTTPNTSTCVAGGNTTLGTVSTTGLYTAPTTIPTPNTVAVLATANADKNATANTIITLDSGVRLLVTPVTATIGIGEQFQFHATVIGSTNTAVNWSLCVLTAATSTAAATCTAGTGLGSIDSNGIYTAPATLPANNSVGVQATSQADQNQISTATATLVTATDPIVKSVYPQHIGQGSVFADVYFTGTSFVSTSTVLVNGQPLTPDFSTATNMHVRLPATLLSTTPTTLTLQVQRQGGSPVSCTPDPTQCVLHVEAVRPAIVSASPDSVPVGGGSFEFNVDGGYFGTGTGGSSPSVSLFFNGLPTPITPTTLTPRQLDATLSSIATPGLFQVAVVNSNVTTPAAAPSNRAATNFALQSVPGTAAVTVSSLSQAGATKPVAIGVNSATGVAVVVNHDSNNLTLIDLTGASPVVVAGGPIAVGNGPTGVAVDSVRNLAVVTNNTDNSLSVVNLSTRAVTTVTANVQKAPFSIAVNPLSGIALVAYQNTNIGTIFDLTQSPPAMAGVVTLPTGANPHVVVEPRLNWAVVTPGGGGLLSIVDLAHHNSNTIAANGAVRVSANNTVTITTTSPHDLITGDSVFITGVADNSFNGIFTVTSAPTTTSFTFTQTGANGTSGGGSALYSRPLATAGLSLAVSGISVNTETKTALLTDASSPSALLMSLLDQSVVSVAVGAGGSVASAMNPYTNTGITINPTNGTASFIDPVTPVQTAAIALPGNTPAAVAIDPGTNLALIANSGSNDVTVLSFGPIKPLELDQIVMPTTRQLNSDLTLASATDLPVTLIGKGFQAGSVARIDGVTLSPSGPVTDRQMSVVVPGALLGTPRRFSMDVQNPDATVSNVEGFSVIQSVDLTSGSCATPTPAAVAVDDIRNLALVAESGCNNLDLVDLTTGAITATVAVGTNPQGVAVNPGVGTAVVTNRGANTAEIIDLTNLTATPTTVSVGGEPVGVDINLDDNTAVVANFNVNSNTISTFAANASATPNTLGANAAGPIAVAIDTQDFVVGVANATSNSVTLFDISTPSSPFFRATLSGPSQPTGIVFDPVNDQFIIASSLTNSVFFADPIAQTITSARIGINPGAIAYNFLTSTVVTANTASNTMSVMDVITRRVKANLGIPSSHMVAIAIQRERNLAVVVDQVNNRLLYVPIPK